MAESRGPKPKNDELKSENCDVKVDNDVASVDALDLSRTIDGGEDFDSEISVIDQEIASSAAAGSGENGPADDWYAMNIEAVSEFCALNHRTRLTEPIKMYNVPFWFDWCCFDASTVATSESPVHFSERLWKEPVLSVFVLESNNFAISSKQMYWRLLIIAQFKGFGWIVVDLGIMRDPWIDYVYVPERSS